VAQAEIASRALVTDAAIVEAVRSCAPRTGLDLGCGEGWLVRALPEVEMVGVDAIAGLVDAAREAGGGEFRVMSYEEIAAGAPAIGGRCRHLQFLADRERSRRRGLLRAAPTTCARVAR
jgi:SAM-dependent methyltransferase